MQDKAASGSVGVKGAGNAGILGLGTKVTKLRTLIEGKNPAYVLAKPIERSRLYCPGVAK